MAQFVIFALPRSRTAWLSKFLNYGGWTCGHDELRHLRSLDDVRSWLSQPFTGTVETAAAPWWRTIRELAPETKAVVVRRPRDEVVDSYLRLGMGFDKTKLTEVMTRLDAKLDQITARYPGVVSVPYYDLDDPECCEFLFEHCLEGFVFDRAWWEYLRQINIQIDMRALIKYMIAYNNQLIKLGKIIKHQTIKTMRESSLRRTLIDRDDLVFEQMPMNEFLAEAHELLSEHQVKIGAAPDEWTQKNLALLSTIYELDGGRITVARCNGKIFGYIIAIISPRFDKPDSRMAMHTIFYASPNIPGLGLRLQRASQKMLTEEGISELYMRNGPGEAERLSVLYRRMGADKFAELYKMELN